MTKFTYEYVKNYIEIKYTGSELLSKKYERSKAKLKIKCANGHIFEAPFNDIKRDKWWCSECSKVKIANKLKHSYDYVKNHIYELHPGARLLSKKYKNRYSDLELLCENGHKFYITYGSIKKGHWCLLCSGINTYDLDYVKKFVDKKHPGAIVKSKKYHNVYTKLNIVCENGHEFKATFNSIKYGIWCKQCYIEKHKFNFEYVKDTIKELHPDAILLSKEYENVDSKLELLCENGHRFSLSFYLIKRGTWCAKCAGNKKFSYEYVKSTIESLHYGSELLSKEYKNVDSKLKIRCENDHIFHMSFYKINKRNQWCPDCILNKGEEVVRHIFNFLYNGDFVKVRPTWLLNIESGYNLELDGYCKELKLAFEYNGEQHYKFPNHFHKTKDRFVSQRKKDNLKVVLCKENNVKLTIIKQFNSFNKRDIIERLLSIKSELNVDENNIIEAVNFAIDKNLLL